MRRLIVAAMALVLAETGGALAAEKADLILYNGKVYTVDAAETVAWAIAVKDGRIVAVGGPEVASAYDAPARIDLNGRLLLPGFTDTHIHIRGLARRDIDAAKARSIVELQAMVRAKAKELGPGEWITGLGWDENLLAEKRNPNRQDLDAAAPDNPVMLARAGNHSGVGNSLALKIVGIDRNSPQPDRGYIEHEANGEPNGVVRERNDLFRAKVPPEKWADLRPGYIDNLKQQLSLGITSVFTMATLDDEPVGQGGVADPSPEPTYRRVVEIYKQAGADLPRATLYIAWPGRERLATYPHHTGHGDDRVRLGAIGEAAIDGGFTGPTAWTLVDYKGMPGFRGRPAMTDAQIKDMMDTGAQLDWQMGVHAIGDAAIVKAVDAYSAALRAYPGRDKTGRDRRWFLDHFTIMPPDATMRKMNEDAIMIAQQPNFTYNLERRYRETMDDWRVAHTNSVATPTREFGLFMAFGSDNLPIGPMVGLYAAVTRKGSATGEPMGLAEEGVSIAEAIRFYTANGPYFSWEEHMKGTIEVGKLADMVVMDRDLLTIPADDILKARVDMTIVGGKVVYTRPQ